MMELRSRLMFLTAMLAAVTLRRAEGNSLQEGPASDYWPTRSELVMPGGHKGAVVPVNPTDDRSEEEGAPSGSRRRGNTVVISVGPGNKESPVQQPVAITPEQWRGRQRNKQARIFMLQQQIMRELQMNSRPNVSSSQALSPSQIEKLKTQMRRREKDSRRQPGRPSNYGEVTRESDTARVRDTMADERGDAEYNSKRFLALPATCPYTTQDWFTNGSKFRLFFLVDPPIESMDRKTRVTSAVLRLRRKSYDSIGDNDAAVNDNDKDDDNDGRTWQPESSRRGGHTTRNQQRANRGREDRRRRKRVNERTKRTPERRQRGSGKLTLTVYQYSEPVQRNQPEIRRLVKSLTLKHSHSLSDGAEWVRINVKAAVRGWYKDPETNHGLELVVMDENNIEIDPRSVFYGFNCSDSTSTEDAAALMSLSMQDEEEEEEESREWSVSHGNRSPAQRIKSPLPSITIPNLYLSTVDTPRRDRKRRLRRRRGDSRFYP